MGQRCHTAVNRSLPSLKPPVWNALEEKELEFLGSVLMDRLNIPQVYTYVALDTTNVAFLVP